MLPRALRQMLVLLVGAPGAFSCSAPPRPAPEPTAASRSLDPRLLAPIADLGVHAASSVVRRDTTRFLQVAASLAYGGDVPKLLSYGGCPLTVLAYRTPERTPPAVWNSEYRRSWTTGQPYFCFSIEVVPTIAPHSTFAPDAFTTSFPVIEVLGDSLPDGRYWFTAGLHVNGTTFTVPAGDADLDR